MKFKFLRPFPQGPRLFSWVTISTKPNYVIHIFLPCFLGIYRALNETIVLPNINTKLKFLLPLPLIPQLFSFHYS